jgi:hypothetical protein
LPSVAHPPLPLQEFLPAQECFSLILAAAALFFFEPSVAHPPFPAQEFLPAQECFSATVLLDSDLVSCIGAAARAMVPPSNPVMAAVNTSELLEIFIYFALLLMI